MRRGMGEMFWSSYRLCGDRGVKKVPRMGDWVCFIGGVFLILC